ncbi:hypothetical protein IF1G_02266 [Cordyceps javanica]|uniref:Uncharacterized protein n=1 Tax=Cordyceps javanica TaxID=43265 RepID=A0A545VE98_9HYPO|nr:hypothetical protein IF1G_02266 [Cordyceps javanica]
MDWAEFPLFETAGLAEQGGSCKWRAPVGVDLASWDNEMALWRPPGTKEDCISPMQHAEPQGDDPCLSYSLERSSAALRCLTVWASVRFGSDQAVNCVLHTRREQGSRPNAL